MEVIDAARVRTHLQRLVALFDHHTGRPLAVIDGGEITRGGSCNLSERAGDMSRVRQRLEDELASLGSMRHLLGLGALEPLRACLRV